jgi:hypothetical protein
MILFYFGIFSSAKRSFILDVIFNTNFEIDNQSVITNTIALNASHSKNQQFHVEFCCLINVF